MQRQLPPGYPSKPDSRGRARKRYHGKLYDFGFWGTAPSLARYREWLTEVTITSKPKPLPCPDRLTISTLIALWLEHERGERGLAHREVKGICRACRPLDVLLGTTLVSEFSANRLRQVQSAMIDGSWMTDEDRKQLAKRNKVPEWSRTYANHQIDRICRVFRWAESRELAPAGMWQHLRTLPPIRRNHPTVRQTVPRVPVDWDSQVEPVLPHLPPAIAAMIRLQAFLGARPCEILHMAPREIDRTTRQDVWLYRPSRHKNTWRGQGLTKVIVPEAQAVLAEWLLRCPDEDCPIFRPSRTSRKPYDSGAISIAVRRACAKLKIKPWTPYSLRHLSKKLATSARGLDAARAFLGQESIDAANHYAHQQDIDVAIEAAKAIAGHFARKTG